MKLLSIILLALLSMSQSVMADEKSNTPNIYFSLGYSGASEQVTDNTDNSEYIAGEGSIIKIGLETPSNHAFRFSLGKIFHDSENSSEKLQTELFETIFIKKFKNHHVGVGLVIHSVPSSWNVDTDSGNTFFDFIESIFSVFDNIAPDVGAILTYEYAINKNMRLGINYTDIAYDLNDVNSTNIDASSLNANFSFRF